MTTVALIGVDGAGKTTIARRLLESFPMPVKYLYMGLNLESSNYALPTSRLILYLKLRAIKKKAKKTGNTDPSYLSTHHVAHRKVKRGQIGTFARTLNRLVEAWYRQWLSWLFQARGYIVLYDRHFLFDISPNPGKEALQHPAERVLHWIITNLYPQPDLVIMLDAPAEVLFSRKQEVPVAYLASRRAAFIQQGQKMANFVQVDAAQPLEGVVQDVEDHIMRVVASSRRGRKRRAAASGVPPEHSKSTQSTR